MGFQLLDERHDRGFARKIAVQGIRTGLAQLGHTGVFGSVTDDDLMPMFKQAQRAMQAHALAGAGNQDRCRR
ncbi:hypothetical protein ALQ30_200103 [Pseudomonas syringae pv. persicae]|uniref:Uncharacterized protein n=1 Tax=Pseudomonas syringae pv. persicae TaxID=237306 RepID=A0A3M3ZUM8_9PSED|nr:hypothetical protein ALQ30_200103 [Pseudomonas syringae pv. persicae]